MGFGPGAGLPASAWAASVSVTQEDGAVVVRNGDRRGAGDVCAKDVVRVTASPDGKAAGSSPHQPWLAKACQAQPFVLRDATRPARAATPPRRGGGGHVGRRQGHRHRRLPRLDLADQRDPDLPGRRPDDRILLQEMGERPRIYEPRSCRTARTPSR
jgi:alpha-D-xyloside xylohydrolase